MRLTTVLLLVALFPLASQGADSIRELYDKILIETDPESWGQASHQEKASALRSESTWFNPEIQWGYGGAERAGFRGYYRELIVSQRISLNNRRSASRKKIEIQKEMSEQEKQLLQLEVGSQVIMMIFFHQYNLERASHIQERVRRLELVENFVRQKRFASPKDRVEKAQIQKRLKLLKIETSAIQNDLEHSLAFFRDYDPTSQKVLKISWPDTEKMKNKFESLFDNKQPFEQQQKLEKQWITTELNAAKTLWRPDVKIYYSENYQYDPQEDTALNAFGVALEIPLFQRGQHERAMAESRLLQAEKRQHFANQIRRQNVLKIKSGFMQAVQTIEAFGDDSIRKADQEMDRATESFKQGLIPATNYLDLEDQVHTSLHMVSASRLKMIESLISLMKENRIHQDLKELFL